MNKFHLLGLCSLGLPWSLCWVITDNLAIFRWGVKAKSPLFQLSAFCSCSEHLHPSPSLSWLPLPLSIFPEISNFSSQFLLCQVPPKVKTGRSTENTEGRHFLLNCWARIETSIIPVESKYWLHDLWRGYLRQHRGQAKPCSDRESSEHKLEQIVKSIRETSRPKSWPLWDLSWQFSLHCQD